MNEIAVAWVEVDEDVAVVDWLNSRMMVLAWRSSTVDT